MRNEGMMLRLNESGSYLTGVNEWRAPDDSGK